MPESLAGSGGGVDGNRDSWWYLVGGIELGGECLNELSEGGAEGGRNAFGGLEIDVDPTCSDRLKSGDDGGDGCLADVLIGENGFEGRLIFEGEDQGDG